MRAPGAPKGTRRTLPIDPAAVRRLRSAGLSYAAIGRVLRCAPGRVWQIQNDYVMPRRTEGKQTPPVVIMRAPGAAISKASTDAVPMSNDTGSQVTA
jgi:hypothetical protein